MKSGEVSEPIPNQPAHSNVVYLHSGRQSPASGVISFHRRELDQILQLYGRKVGSGEWRDYAIDMMKDRAVFSVFRRSSEQPMFMIEKNPKLHTRQGAWSVAGSNGQILKRGHELTNILKFFEKKRPRLVLV